MGSYTKLPEHTRTRERWGRAFIQRETTENVPFNTERTVVVHKLSVGEGESESEDKKSMEEIVRLLKVTAKVVGTKRIKRQGDFRTSFMNVELESKQQKIRLVEG